MTIQQYRERCKCGHEKTTHFGDPATGKRLSCLAFGDCPCRCWRSEWDEDTPPTLRGPAPLPPPTVPDDDAELPWWRRF